MAAEAGTGRPEDDGRKPAGARSVGSVLVLTVVTLTVYFYFYVFRSLRELAASAMDPGSRSRALQARMAVGVGLGIQFVAFLLALLALVPVLQDPRALDALLAGLQEMQFDLPPTVRTAESVADLGTWLGWLVFWGWLLAFLGRAQSDEGLPAGAIGFAGVLIVFRTLVGLGGLVGADSLASSVGAWDGVLYLILVGCVASGINAVQARRSARPPQPSPTGPLGPGGPG